MRILITLLVPGMGPQLAVDFTQYLPDIAASTLAQLDDAQSFEQIDEGNLAHAAVLRFTHAEIIMPLASRLGLDGASTPIAKADTFNYGNSTWRGAAVSPYAANIQWDVFKGADGTLLVHMLHNERQIYFKPACDSARYAANSHFYVYKRLRSCYGR